MEALATRHVDLQAQRSRIAAERSSGFDDPSHGPTLALINLDSEDLTRLIAEAKTVVDKAKVEAATAGNHVAQAVLRLEHVTSEETLARLKPIATDLLAKLDLALQGIMTEAKALGRRCEWTPDVEAFNRLNRLHQTRGLV